MSDLDNVVVIGVCRLEENGERFVTIEIPSEQLVITLQPDQAQIVVDKLQEGIARANGTFNEMEVDGEPYRATALRAIADQECQPDNP